MENQQVLLEVVGVRVELPSNQPVLILRGADPGTEDYHVAVVVGPAEAAAVARAMQGETPPRPMTHDLLTQVLESLGGGVDSVEVRLLDTSTYAGTIRLHNGQQLDARASDAIAVAVRAQCRVTMNKTTLRAVSVVPRSPGTEVTKSGSRTGSPEGESVPRKDPISEAEIREFEKFLSDAEPEDFDRS